MHYHCCCLACLQLLRQFDGVTDRIATVLQVSIPLWALVHLPVVVTVTTAIFTPKGWLHCILYVLFENAMGIVKMGAVIAGTHANHVVRSFPTLLWPSLHSNSNSLPHSSTIRLPTWLQI